MADVILARVAGVEGFERHVVVKRIRTEQGSDPRFVQMFLEEARLAASLHHHNIVQVHELSEDGGEYFFAMEYVHGEDLRKVLGHLADHDQRMPIDHCVTIALNTAAALHHAHELRGPDRRPLGIVHCDVSPANILVGLDGDVKLVDFGIATGLGRTSHTGTNLLAGKAAYMSPEQCLSEPLDRRSDVFCLGIVLYELVTVRRLFKGANDFLTMAAIINGEIPAPRTIRPDLPLGLETIILKALAFEAADRYQTADELRSALERFAVEARLQTSATALADYMRGLFGDRVMPWLAEEDEPEISIDFDGDASGIVSGPAADLRDAPGSRLAKARAKAGTTDAAAGPARIARGSEPAVIVDIDEDEEDPAEAVERASASRRSRWWLAAGAVIAAVAAVIIVASSGSRSRTSTPPVTAIARPPVPSTPPAAAIVNATTTAPPTTAPTTTVPTTTAPTTIVPTTTAPTTTAPTTTAPVAGTPRRKPGRRPDPPARGVWNPKALFPPKS